MKYLITRWQYQSNVRMAIDVTLFTYFTFKSDTTICKLSTTPTVHIHDMLLLPLNEWDCSEKCSSLEQSLENIFHETYVWWPREASHIGKSVFIQEMENNTLSNAVCCIQIFPLEAKLQEFKEGPYHK